MTATHKSRVLNLGSVSYLNARPLIHGLELESDLRLHLDVPARLLGGLRDGRYDVALLPSIDYQRLPGLRVLPVGGIGSDGAALTVRLFSRIPFDQIRTLGCDPESHTSVALARILLAERFDVHPAVGELSASRCDDAILLIGDKVVCDPPVGFGYDLDLGQAWKELTGLPFLFAVWMARAEVPLRDLPERLKAARERGLSDVERIVGEHAVPRGWTADLARQYLTERLVYDVSPPMLQAVRLFHQKAHEHELIGPPRELAVHPQA